MKDIIIVAILIVIVALVVFYIYKAKKKGQRCIGCPYAGKCSGKKDGSCGGCGSCH